MTSESNTQVDELPGEARGISSVNLTPSSTSKRALIMLGLLIFCTLVSVAYWQYRRHVGQTNQPTDQKELHLTSTVPARTFVDPPTPPVPSPSFEVPPPFLPEPHQLTLGKSHPTTLSRSHPQHKIKPPHVLDKAGSSLMATATEKSHAPQSVSVTSEDQPHGMAKRLSGTPTSMRQAEQLKDRNFILAKGSFIDCALQTKLDSTVPGMTACVVTRDIYSDNGKIVLIERGSTVSGEYKANLRQGMARIFVLWTRIKTSHGVIVNLDSPGADQLGGAGISGYIDDHFWQRFGGALLLSLVDDVVGAASSRLGQQNEGQINLSETVNSSQDMATEALKNTINIPPTLYKNQGEQIGIYVARDLDFSSVYDVASHE